MSCNTTWGLRAQLILLQLLTPVPRCAIFDSNVFSCLLQSPETVSHLCCSEPLPGYFSLHLQHGCGRSFWQLGPGPCYVPLVRFQLFQCSLLKVQDQTSQGVLQDE